MGNSFKVFKPFKMLANSPIVVVLGCTGTGKSKLAIEIAQKFNGEVISADSMQVYKGLDIITNKVTTEEQCGVIHHCIDYIDPLSRYTVVDFQKQALPIINRLIQEKKLPIIVGGTNYYIESLLWNVLLHTESESGTLLFENDVSQKTHLFPPPIHLSSITQELLNEVITPDSFENVPSSVLHGSLKEIDPAMADSLHPEDRRKVIRSLQVYQQHGRPHSEILHQQRAQSGGSSLGGPLRFSNAIMLWIQCDDEILKQRLDDRVDEMIERGLISELLDFHKRYNEKRIDEENSRYTEGIFQSIGFKEFHEYLILPEEEKETEKGRKCLKKGIEDMKVITKQYARKQRKWIVNRFLKKPDRQVPPIYSLPATDIEKWSANVTSPALEIVNSVLQGKKPKQVPLPVEEPINNIKESYYCDVCERVILGRETWKIHINSKKHHKRKASLKKVSQESQKCIDSS